MRLKRIGANISFDTSSKMQRVKVVKHRFDFYSLMESKMLHLVRQFLTYSNEWDALQRSYLHNQSLLKSAEREKTSWINEMKWIEMNMRYYVLHIQCIYCCIIPDLLRRLFPLDAELPCHCHCLKGSLFCVYCSIIHRQFPWICLAACSLCIQLKLRYILNVNQTSLVLERWTEHIVLAFLL